MKIRVITCILLLNIFFIGACVAEDSQYNKACEILNSLNAWDKAEIDAYERPEYYVNELNIIASGETAALLDLKKQGLTKLGYKAVWNEEEKVYELFPLTDKDD
ncbi:MAG: hypothetical protein ABIB11_05450 [Candidatus Omnitrophota bacterium]